MPSPNQSKHCPVYTLYIQQPDRIYIWPQWMENNKQNIYLSLSVATRNKGNVQCRAYHASLIISVIREHAPGPHFGSASAFFPRSVRGDDAWTAGNTRLGPGIIAPAEASTQRPTVELPVRFFKFPSPPHVAADVPGAAAAIDNAPTCVAAIDNARAQVNVPAAAAAESPDESVWSRHATPRPPRCVNTFDRPGPRLRLLGRVRPNPEYTYTVHPTRLLVYPHVWYMLVGRSPPQMSKSFPQRGLIERP